VEGSLPAVEGNRPAVEGSLLAVEGSRPAVGGILAVEGSLLVAGEEGIPVVVGSCLAEEGIPVVVESRLAEMGILPAAGEVHLAAGEALVVEGSLPAEVGILLVAGEGRIVLAGEAALVGNLNLPGLDEVLAQILLVDGILAEKNARIGLVELLDLPLANHTVHHVERAYPFLPSYRVDSDDFQGLPSPWEYMETLL